MGLISEAEQRIGDVEALRFWFLQVRYPLVEAFSQDSLGSSRGRASHEHFPMSSWRSLRLCVMRRLCRDAQACGVMRRLVRCDSQASAVVRFVRAVMQLGKVARQQTTRVPGCLR